MVQERHEARPTLYTPRSELTRFWRGLPSVTEVRAKNTPNCPLSYVSAQTKYRYT